MLKLVILFPLLLISTIPAHAQGWNIEPVCYIPFWPGAADIEYQNGLAYVAAGQCGLCVVDVSDPNDPTQVAFLLDSSLAGAGNVDLEGDRMLVYGSHFTPPNIYEACVVLLDLSDPINPSYLSSYISPNHSFNNAILAGDYAYVVSTQDELAILDFSNPAAPTLAAVFPLIGEGYPMIVIGDLLYVGVSSFSFGGIEVIDVSNPYAPQQVSFGSLGVASSNLELWNGYLLALRFDYFEVLDISIPANPRVVSTLAMNASLGMTVFDDRVYCGWGLDGGLAVVDISNPLAPQLMGTCDLPDQVLGVAADGALAYVADYEGGLRVVNATNPLVPVEIGSCGESNQIYEMDLSNNYAYLCGDWHGFYIVNTLDSDSIIGRFESQDYVYSIAASDSYAYAASGEDFSVLGVTDPAHPVLLGTLNFGQSIYSTEIVIAGSCAYLIGGHFIIVDISNPYQPQQLSALYWMSASGACIVDTLAFVAGVSDNYPNYDGYIKVLNVSNPASPQQVGYLWLPEPALDIQISGNYAYVAESEAGLCVVNVANYAAMQVVATYNTPGSARRVAISDNHVFLADEGGGILVFDVSNPANPILTGSYNTPGEAYDLAVDGNLVYVADLYYFSTYDASAALAPVTISLSPVNPPIQIPPTGGSFSFDATLDNATSSVQTFDVWIMVQLPSQSWYGPILGPLSLTLQVGATLTRLRTQSVPAGAPAGEYWYEGRVGDYPTEIWDTGGFGFTKLGAGDEDLGFGQWTNTGEDFGEMTGKIITDNSSFITSISPNPFNATTALSFQLSADSYVRLRVYDTGGRLVATLVDGWREAGEHEAVFDGSALASGIYICRLKAGDFVATQKLVLLK